jgi:hypothetical protein
LKVIKTGQLFSFCSGASSLLPQYGPPLTKPQNRQPLDLFL